LETNRLFIVLRAVRSFLPFRPIRACRNHLLVAG
jgi:hypothetical protein